MTEAPDVYPDSPDDDESAGSVESDDQGVQGVPGGPDESGRSDDVRTGDWRVDEALASLTELDELPVSEHAEVFERAHDRLRAALEPDRESA